MRALTLAAALSALVALGACSKDPLKGAAAALQAKDWARAEAVLDKAVAEHPEAPALRMQRFEAGMLLQQFAAFLAKGREVDGEPSAGLPRPLDGGEAFEQGS